MNISLIIIIGIIVMLSMGLESITGFGATILSLPFLGIFLDVKSAVALMSMLSGMFGLYVFFKDRQNIHQQIVKNILVFGGIGLPIGILLFSFLPERWLKIILGIFVTFSAVRALIQRYVSRYKNVSSHSQNVRFSRLDQATLLAGGIFHGAFAAGGPLFTLYVNRHQLNKTQFRATMTFIWVIFNTVLLIKNICIGGIITADLLKLLLFVVPFLFVGIMAGSFLHKRVSTSAFSLLTNLLLLAAGLSTLLAQLRTA